MQGREIGNNNCQFLPPGWEQAYDKARDRYFYVNHNNKTTTWLNPEDRRTKPLSFNDCYGDQLPYGWEKVIHPNIGVYYVNHIERRNQWTNPMLEHVRLNYQRMNLLNQPHYSNSQQILCSEKIGNSLDSNNRTISPSATSRPDTLFQASDLDKSATSLNNSTNLDADNIGSSRSNTSTRGSQYDASLLNIMDNCFGRESSQSVEV